MNRPGIVETLLRCGFRGVRYLHALRAGNSSAQYLPENWSTEQVEEERNLRLYNLLIDIADRFPFWKDRMRSCGLLDEHGVICLTNFTQLPILERDDLLVRQNELVDEGFPGETWWDQTGGSTGEPVRILKDYSSKKAMLQSKAQMHGWAGHRAGLPVVELWGAERDILEQRYRQPLWNLPMMRRVRCQKLIQNAFRMGEKQMRQYLEEWHWFRPHTIISYAHSIHELARFAAREGILPYRPKAIITSAGTLTDEMRIDIRRVFGAPVFNRYGSREFGNIAMSCEQQDGLHIIPTAVHVEIIRPDGSPAEPGELGEILVTSLTARAMPLIRYRIGDAGSWGKPCACGRPLPVISQVAGRHTDNFIGVNEELIHGEYFTHLVWHLEAIRKFQVVQEDIDHVRFRLVLAENSVSIFDRQTEELRLTEETRKAMGPGCRISFEYPEDIEPNVTGKHRFTISQVARDCA